MLTIQIPGCPVPQGRGRIVWLGRTRQRAGIADPKDARAWKAEAAAEYMLAVARAGHSRPYAPRGLPVYLAVDAVFPRPVSARPTVTAQPHVGRGDLDNVLKAVCDAGNGVLWADDRQVAQVFMGKWVARIGTLPYVRVRVRMLYRDSSQYDDTPVPMEPPPDRHGKG